MLSVQEISDAVSALLRTIGASAPAVLEAIPGGASNRVFRVVADGSTYFLKAYHPLPGTSRRPLHHDWSFSRFAWDHGLRNIPRPVACDREHDLALFDFVPGQRLAPYDIGQESMLDAAKFFAALNQLRNEPSAAELPPADGAHFTLAAALDDVAGRIEALQAIEPTSPASEAARQFTRGELLDAWSRLRENVERVSDIDLRAELPQVERCLTPGDFGFHNVLVLKGRSVFHDFECAGWDDPARVACEFFCQMQTPAPWEFAKEFLATALAGFPDEGTWRRRAGVLWPVTRFRWVCVVLNDFLPPSITRRQYAGQPPSELRKTRQLEMARLLLTRARDEAPWT